MPDPNPEVHADDSAGESFDSILSQFERGQSSARVEPGQSREATVITVSADSIILDVGFKIEGVLPLTALRKGEAAPKPGDKLLVTIKGRGPEGYYELARGRVERPTDWAALEKAFADKTPILGTVTAAVKGGLSVDVGVRAFMPASRSGVRDAAEMEKLVGQEIRCRITKLDATDEDVVVDRRILAEEEAAAGKKQRYAELQEGQIARGTVRSVTDYGAFVDIGGVDALLHVSDISWSRVNKPADVLSVGQEIDVQILKLDREKNRISVGMKQLLAHPWDAVPAKYRVGERANGSVTRLMEFGAFVELEPGIEGLIHISEMSWARKIRKVSDVLKPGETVEAVILGVNAGERRISLGLKQALGDPWVEAAQRFPIGTIVEGTVTSLAKFGAFVQVADGIEGLIHISDLSAEKTFNHPQDALKIGQAVKAQILELDTEKRRLRLGIKQLTATGLDEYLAEHRVGDVVSGRVMEITGDSARVELGDGIQSPCRIAPARPAGGSNEGKTPSAPKTDLSSLTSLLQARWKGGALAASSMVEEVRAGQVRRFRIAKLDPASKLMELELAE